jgi:hypothetical protein
MLKKWIFISTMITALIIGIYFVPNNNHPIETINLSANYIEANTFAELEAMADLVVVASSEQPFLQRNHIIKQMKDSKGNDLPAIMDMFTRTEIVIEKVIKQPTSENFTTHDKLVIIEPITYDSMKKTKITIAHYKEMKENQSYIIFLAKNTYGNYSVINMNNGKYNLETLKRIGSVSNLVSKHQNLAKEIVNNYKNILQ